MRQMRYLLLLVCAGVLSAADFYVDPPTEGFANEAINRALSEAQAGDRIVLRAGEYRVEKPIRFQQPGTAEKPITFQAEHGAIVSLLGSVRLLGWEHYQGAIWRIAKPRRMPQGLYQNGARLTHPRPHWGKRVNPELSELVAPGTWTQDKEYVYLWPRGGSTPDDYRIEASQNYIMVVDKPYTRVQGINFFYGQNVNIKIEADYCEVVDCEIAHCSNSVDNSYNAYLGGCSFSKFKNCVIHDSYYWGDHGSNSHVFSCIDAGDKGPNFVEGCVIFNGGLGVGTKGAVRELVVKDCKIYDVIHGVTVSGERVSGPGAGKKDRGHYRLLNNYFYQCQHGVKNFARSTQGTWVWNNTFNQCGSAIYIKSRNGIPPGFKALNNLIMNSQTGVHMVAGRDGESKIDAFVAAGIETKGNVFFNCKNHWRSPISWSKDVVLNVGDEALAAYPVLGEGCAADIDPQHTFDGFVAEASPCLGAGIAHEMPHYEDSERAKGVGRGTYDGKRSGLTLSIAGSQELLSLNQPIQLRATLQNVGAEPYDFGDHTDAIVTYYVRYRNGHADKQEVFRVRVPLHTKSLLPGASLTLSDAAEWVHPHNGALGDVFHVRKDTKEWAQGYRLYADVQFVTAAEKTQDALQVIRRLLRAEEVLRLHYAAKK